MTAETVAAHPPIPAPAPSAQGKPPLLKYAGMGLVALIVLAGLALLGYRAVVAMNRAGAHIVVVDVSAIINAQRAAMSMDPVEGRMTVMRAGKVAEEVIREIAGKEAVILVKQSVVALDTSNVRDITKEVLEALQLPTDAPPTVSIPPVASHLYSEQGRELLAADRQRASETDSVNRKWEEDQDRKNSLIP